MKGQLLQDHVAEAAATTDIVAPITNLVFKGTFETKLLTDNIGTFPTTTDTNTDADDV